MAGWGTNIATRCHEMTYEKPQIQSKSEVQGLMGNDTPGGYSL